MLPLLLSVVNDAKAKLKWLWTGQVIDREEVERVIKEMKTQEVLEGKLAEANGKGGDGQAISTSKKEKSTVLEEQS